MTDYDQAAIDLHKKLKGKIEIANGLDVHFQASVFTKNLNIAIDTVKKLNATSRYG